jgi:hypothetical protein
VRVIIGAAAALAVAVVAVVVVVRRLGRRPDATEELSGVVLTAFAADWAERFETDEAAIRLAVANGDGADPRVRTRLATGVSLVDLKLERIERSVRAHILCEYPQQRERATAELGLSWDETPADVREEFLRTGRTEVFRKWTLAAPVAG